jgi:hypothetical protein
MNNHASPCYHVFEQRLPDIRPLDELKAPLLGNAMTDMSEPSVAEYVLSLHHEYCTIKTPGLPMGPVESEVFDFFWKKVEQHGHSALLIPLCTIFEDAERDMFITLHSDQSALLWQATSKEDYAPIPQPFHLMLEDTHHQKYDLGTYKSLGSSRLDADQFVAEYWDLPKEASDGEITLRHAILHEARQWVSWLKEALPVPCPRSNMVGPSRVEILYPWLFDLNFITPTEKATFRQLACDVLTAMALHVGIQSGTGAISVMGREFRRDSSIGSPKVYLGWGDGFDNTDLNQKWSDFFGQIIESEKFPVPLVSQISQNSTVRTLLEDKELELYKSRSLIWVTQDVDNTLSGHDKIQIMERVTSFGIPLPS